MDVALSSLFFPAATSVGAAALPVGCTRGPVRVVAGGEPHEEARGTQVAFRHLDDGVPALQGRDFPTLKSRLRIVWSALMTNPRYVTRSTTPNHTITRCLGTCPVSLIPPTKQQDHHHHHHQAYCSHRCAMTKGNIQQAFFEVTDNTDSPPSALGGYRQVFPFVRNTWAVGCQSEKIAHFCYTSLCPASPVFLARTAFEKNSTGGGGGVFLLHPIHKTCHCDSS